jgi:alpha-tubulin suppressor-like RCC1 family protein
LFVIFLTVQLTPSARAVPATLSAEPFVEKISAGNFHNCALQANHGVQCWGRNDCYQLGIGNETESTVPVSVIGL